MYQWGIHALPFYCIVLETRRGDNLSPSDPEGKESLGSFSLAISVAVKRTNTHLDSFSQNLSETFYNFFKNNFFPKSELKLTGFTVQLAHIQ